MLRYFEVIQVATSENLIISTFVIFMKGRALQELSRLGVDWLVDQNLKGILLEWVDVLTTRGLQASDY